jgi:anti-sigma factor RsiW
MESCQEITPQLSLFIDGGLDAEARAAVAAHVEGCASCRGLARDLERVRAAGRQLEPIEPPAHVWLEVAGQIRLGSTPVAPVPPRPAPARPSRGALAQWFGLAAALVVITIGAYFFVREPLPGDGAPAATAGNAAPAGSVESVAEQLRLAMQHYENAITELETLAQRADGSLDPAIALTLQQNIRAIDRAIAESREALTDDPESQPARESLFDALRRKVSVLQATVTLMNEMRQGNPAGAAEAAAGLSKKG